MNKTALLIVDVQNDFLPPDGALPAPKGNEIIPVIQRLLDPAEWDWSTVVASQDFHPPKHISFASRHGIEPFQNKVVVDGKGRAVTLSMWPDHCVQGTPGCALEENVESGLAAWKSQGRAKLARKAADPDVEQYSMFEAYLSEAIDSRQPDQSTASEPLHSYLRHRGVDKVVVVGLVTDYCVRDTALAAVETGFETIVCLSGCSGIDDKAAEAAMQKVMAKGAVVLERTGDWDTKLRAAIRS